MTSPRHAQRLINTAIVVGSLTPYLEWGGGNAAFLAQVEYTLLFGGTTSSDAFLHPMVGLPLTGQLLILFTLLQHTPSRLLTTVGVALLSVLVLLIAVVGVLSLNGKIVLSTYRSPPPSSGISAARAGTPGRPWTRCGKAHRRGLRTHARFARRA